MKNRIQLLEDTKDIPAFTIDIDGTITEVKPENNSDFSLDEMYKHTGCEMVQVVPFQIGADRRIVICDEEGELNDKHPNPQATELLRGHVYMPAQGMLGKVLICAPDMVQ